RTIVSPFALVLAAILSVLTAALSAQDSVPLESGWKFAKGDNPAYADPAFDDSGWSPILVDRVWETQGNDPYDGYAWYRLRLVIPSKIRDNAPLKDGLRLSLGKINNFDLAFLNGRVFGRNGKVVSADTPLDDSFTKEDMMLYDLPRAYILPFDDPRILWDKENVIAVRVFDEGGQGGLYAGEHVLRAVRFRDYVSLDVVSAPFVLVGPDLEKPLTLTNASDIRTFQGTLSLRAVAALTGRSILKEDENISLAPGQKIERVLHLPRLDESMDLTFEIISPEDADRWEYKASAPYILTPEPLPQPRLTGPKIIGVRPEKPVLHVLTATGRKPITFNAAGLPLGLSLNPKTGIITGRTKKSGDYDVEVTARNAAGEDRRILNIVIGSRIALTPPLGWNSWNAWGTAVDAEKVKDSARVFVEKGLRDHGWTYINVDDGWEIKGDDPRPKRGPDGRILTNEKFPDMRALGDAIHALGLKFGIYSSPGPLTCAGYTGSHKFETQDARSFADWGVDYLKYDWCSYDRIAASNSVYELKKPYRLMRKALDAQNRDIVFSLCQYGLGKVWEWGDEVGGNLWRTTEDITDTWESMRDIGFKQVENAEFAGPGHWNDPDMLVVGWVGWGPSLHPTRLSPDEQYAHISLWCLLSAPLLIGCDLTRLDAFTLNLLTNDEVLAVDQDPLGRQAVPAVKAGDIQVWIKELEDGGRAVGVFNLGPTAASYALESKTAGLKGLVLARDLWRQKAVNSVEGKIDVRIPAHGVVLLKLSK
ncbi:MAG: putative Ig domain-containing protein, partial [Candidatus Aminicenantales bacterium]